MTIKVGDKLSLVPPWEGRYFHFDAIHRLPGNTVLWNGDRRLGEFRDMQVTVAGAQGSLVYAGPRFIVMIEV